LYMFLIYLFFKSNNELLIEEIESVMTRTTN